MKLPRVFLATIALGLSVGGGASAQQESGTRLPKDQEWEVTESQAKAIQTTHRMAECVVKSRGDQWSQVLAEVPGTAVEAEKTRRLAVEADTCLGMVAGGAYDLTQLRFKPSVLRGPIAEALLERNFYSAVRRRDKLARPFEMGSAIARPEMSDRTRTSLIVLDFAECVYRSAAADTNALFATEPASPAEKAAIDRLVPRLGPCLSTGMEFTFNPLFLRGALAEAAYRHAVTAAVFTQTGTQN